MTGYSKSTQLGHPVKKKPQRQKNIDANKKLDELYKQKGIDSCEAGVAANCLITEKCSRNGILLKLTYAHRHKRSWYKSDGRMSLLSAFTETIKCCLPCHMQIEYNRKLANHLFIKLRGTQLSRKAE